MNRSPALRPSLCILLICQALLSCNQRQTDNNPPQEAVPSQEELEETSAAVRLNALGDSVFSLGEYAAAITFYQQSMDSAAVEADSFPYYDAKLDIACVHDRLGELETAIKMALPVLEAFIRSGDSTRIGRTYTSLAGFYSKAGLPEKSMAATRKGFDILKLHGPPMHRCAAYNQMAFTYSDMGRWADALPLLDTALQFMELSGEFGQHPGMLLNIGNCHRELGHLTEARLYLETARVEADSLGQAHILARTLERLSQVAETTGDPALALHLFRQAKGIRDSLFTAEKDRTLRELEVEYQSREKEQQIILLQSENQTAEERRKLIVTGFLFALTILGVGLYANRLKLAHAQKILAQNRLDLQEYTQLLLTKNARLTALGQTTEQPGRNNREVEPEPKDDVQPDSLYNSRILTEQDWENFKRRFESVHPGYLLRLRAAYPELSGAEERLLLLIKLGLTSQEVADTLGISGNGVKKGRQRLRKRLEIAPEEDLELFVKALLERK